MLAEKWKLPWLNHTQGAPGTPRLRLTSSLVDSPSRETKRVPREMNTTPLHYLNACDPAVERVEFAVDADNLKKAGWSFGWISTIDSNERTISIADAHRDGKRFVVRTDEKLTAFLELEAAIPLKIRRTSRRPSRTANRSAYRGKTTNS